LAGEATETIASSTTGVAEDVVRLVEDFAGSLSSALSPDEREKRRVHAKVKIDSIRHKESNVEDDDISYVTFGSYAAPSIEQEEEPPPPASDRWHKMHIDEKSLVDLVEMGIDEFWKLVDFAMADTQGVPSFAGELLGAMIICYLAALWLVSSSPAPSSRREVPERQGQDTDGRGLITHVVLPTSEDDVSELTDHHESGPAGSRTAGARGQQVDRLEREQRHAKASCCSWFIGILFLPFRTFLFLLSMVCRTIFNKLTLLLVLYGGAWMYLCRASQLRSSAIQR